MRTSNRLSLLMISAAAVLPVADCTAPNAAAAAPVVRNLLRLAFAKSVGFFDVALLFESMGFFLPALVSRLPGELLSERSARACLVAKCTPIGRGKARFDRNGRCVKSTATGHRRKWPPEVLLAACDIAALRRGQFRSVTSRSEIPRSQH